MISFQLVQSILIHNEVSNRKDRILSHSPGRGSGVRAWSLQGSLSWCGGRAGYWGAVFFLTQRLELLTERNPILSFLCLFRKRTGENGKSAAEICLCAVGGHNKQGWQGSIHFSAKIGDWGLKLRSLALESSGSPNVVTF